MKTTIVIPTASDCSEGEDLYRRFMKKELSAEEYNTMNAQLTCALVLKEKILKYIEPSSELRQYVDGRAVGGEYNQQLGVRLGAWVDYTERVFDEHETTIEHLRWCIGKLRIKNMTEEIEQLQSKIYEIKNLLRPSFFEKAITTQKRDAIFRSQEKYSH